MTGGVEPRSDTPAGTDPEGGRRIGSYRLVKKLGQGGAGFVYSAVEVEHEIPVALKLFAGIVDPLGRERFVQEASLATRVRHPNVIGIYDAGEVEGKLYIAYELMDDKDLDQVLADRVCFQACEAVEVARQIALGLGALHQAGIVHRDVKPANIFYRSSDQRWVLGDLGVAKDRTGHSLRTGSGIMMGTPEYIAPEYAKGEPAEEPADQYSLGVLFFEMLSGRRPIEGRSPDELFRNQLIGKIKPDYLPDHAALRAIVLRMLESEPTRRFPSMAAVVEALEGLTGLQTLALPELEVKPRDPTDTQGKARARRASQGRTRPAAVPGRPEAGRVPWTWVAGAVAGALVLAWLLG